MKVPTAGQVAKRLRKLKVVNAESLRQICKEVLADVADVPGRDVKSLALELVDEAPPGAYGIAHELVRLHPTALTTITERDLRRFGKKMDGWGEVDCVSGIAGAAWRIGRIDDGVIHKWTRSKSRWWRRAALVSTVPLNLKADGGVGDSKRTLAVCRLLLDDRDDMVEKAMSWALRALAVREPQSVEKFLEKYESRLCSRALREVRNKLRSGRKDGKPGRAKLRDKA